MTEKRGRTEAEAMALEAMLRHARGLAAAIESYATAAIESRIDEIKRRTGTPPTVTPEP